MPQKREVVYRQVYPEEEIEKALENYISDYNYKRIQKKLKKRAQTQIEYRNTLAASFLCCLPDRG
ncbi:IS3 family transposase [Cytobacillus oceanisediminis]|uniref:IS3 family transposase n=1 Tax=Cytobacillus oceanisediminis TaxID=665099 RepID=UPI003D767DA1